MTGVSSTPVTITCSKHRELLVSGLWNFLTIQHGVDLHLGGPAIPAHRLILEVFLPPDKIDQSASLLASTSTADNQSAQTTLLSLVEFLYRGTVTVDRGQLDGLYHLAQQFEFQILVNAVESARTTGSGRHVTRREVGTGRQSNRFQKSKPEQIVTETATSETEASSVLERLSRPTRGKRKLGRVASKVGKNTSKGDGIISEPQPYITNCKLQSALKCCHDYGESKSACTIKEDIVSESELEVAKSKRKHRSDAKHGDFEAATDCERAGKNVDTGADTIKLNAAAGPDLEAAKSKRKHGSVDVLPDVAVTHQCPHCEFVTPKYWKYLRHLKAVHDVNAKGERVLHHVCTECDFRCMYPSELTVHVKTKHRHERPYRCEICSFTAGRKGDVSRHVKVSHFDVKPFLCDRCSFRFVSRSKLEKHQRMHSGEKPFRCDWPGCGQRYSHHGAFKSHVQRHVQPNDKNFVCHLCGHSCNRRDNLNAHLRNVHKDNPGIADRPETVT